MKFLIRNAARRWAPIAVVALLLAAGRATPDEDGEGEEPVPMEGENPGGMPPTAGGFAAGEIDYEAADPLALATSSFEAFAKGGWTATADTEPTEGAFLFVRKPGEGGSGPEYAYRVDAESEKTAEDAPSLSMSAFFLTRDGTDENGLPVVKVGPRVLHRRGCDPAEAAAIARSLVTDAEAAADDWARVAEVAARTSDLAKDPEDADRMRWRAVARALERAIEKHPEHVGMLHDLLLAYARLLPLETGTATGATLALLIPDRLDAWYQAIGELKPEEWTVMRGVEAAYAFHTGLYPRVAEIVAEDPEDTSLQSLGAALEGLGYASFAPLDPVTVESGGSEGPTYVVTPVRAEGEAHLAKVDFNRVTYLVRRQESETGATTFVLAERPLAEDGSRRRWALYSQLAGTKRLVRLYGETEPPIEQVTAQVVSLVRTALGQPEEAR